MPKNGKPFVINEIRSVYTRFSRHRWRGLVEENVISPRYDMMIFSYFYCHLRHPIHLFLIWNISALNDVCQRSLLEDSFSSLSCVELFSRDFMGRIARFVLIAAIDHVTENYWSFVHGKVFAPQSHSDDSLSLWCEFKIFSARRLANLCDL